MKVTVKVRKRLIDAYAVGDRVVRGNQWQYGSQDCDMSGEQREGTITRVIKKDCYDHPIEVRWDHGNTNVYRIVDIAKVKTME